MACTPINLTKEQVVNILTNKGLLFEMRPDLTVDDLLARYNYLQTNMYLPEKEGAKYSIFEHEIAKRASDISKEAYTSRMTKSFVEKELNKPDFIKKKDAGTRIHSILADLMNVKLGKDSLENVRAKANQGDYAVSGSNFQSLIDVVNEIHNDILNTQKEIDPKGKATILIEQRIVDPVLDLGGTMDIHVVFSDMTGAIYDYKTAHSNSSNYKLGMLSDELLHENKIADNELTMSEYKRITMQRIGIKEIRHTRLVPIHVRLELKDENQQKDFDYYNPTFDFIEAGSHRSKYLKQIPVAGEATKYKGINAIIEKQSNLINNLTTRLNEDKLSSIERDRLNSKVILLRKANRTSIINGEIFDIITTANKIIAEINIRLHQPKIINEKQNPDYLENDELKELIDEANVYSDIIENTAIYYRDLKEEHPEHYERLKSEISVFGSNLSMALTDAKMERENRTLLEINDEYKDKEGGLKPLNELDFFTRNFTRISEIDHPIFKTAWGMIQSKLYDQRKALKKLSDEIFTKDEEIAKWAKANGISKMDALAKLINFKDGNLIDIVSPELKEKIEAAYSNPDNNKAYDTLSDLLEIKDEVWYEKDFERRYNNYAEKLKYRYEGDMKGYKKALDKYYADYNLLKSRTAWTNRHNRHYLKYIDEVKTKNYSPEYKEILKHKPLLDYYNMYTKQNDIFRKMLGINRYSKLPHNFIANVRKTMTDSISVDSFGDMTKYIAGEMFDSFNVRQEDVYISDRDNTGALRRTIPKLFLNPIRNNDGQVDNTRKSYDLSKNLMIFAKMAYNYEAMNEIEPKVLALREIMAHPTSEQGGTIVKDSLGRTIKGRTQEFATKKGFDTDTYKLFEDLTDYYLYGLKFKTDNAKTVKTILKLKDYYTKKALSFAIIPGIGAYLAGNTAAFFESKKGISYESKHITEAGKNMVKDWKKYKALAMFFDPYAEDPINVLTENKSVNWFSKIATTRNMFYPLRKADEHMTDALLNRMALNYGIDKDGNVIRMNRPGLDLTNVKSIYELTSLDPKTGKLTIKGITDANPEIQKRNFIKFRNAVRTTSANIIGSLSQEEISRIDTNLVYNLMFQFKTWMPGVIRERSGNLVWDEKIDAVRWGRYRAAFAEYGLTSSEVEGGVKINKFIQSVILPNLAQMSLDLITFGLAPKLGLVGEEYTTQSGKTIKVRSNINRAKRLYNDWLNKNPHLQGKISFEDFLQTKEGQMKAMLVELRTIISFIAFLAFLGGGGDDGDEPRYMQTWMTRFLYKNLSKANSELTFMWSPEQFAKLISNPLPMSSILTDVIKLLRNTYDEGRDVIFGEDSTYDKSPAFFYTIQLAYGGNQLGRFFELYESQKKSPY